MCERTRFYTPRARRTIIVTRKPRSVPHTTMTAARAAGARAVKPRSKSNIGFFARMRIFSFPEYQTPMPSGRRRRRTSNTAGSGKNNTLVKQNKTVRHPFSPRRAAFLFTARCSSKVVFLREKYSISNTRYVSHRHTRPPREIEINRRASISLTRTSRRDGLRFVDSGGIGCYNDTNVRHMYTVSPQSRI